MKNILLATAVAALCVASIAQAQTSAPRILNYQAAIRSANGAVMDGNRSVTIRLYRDEAGRELAWSDTFDATVTNGILDLALGSHTPLPADLDRATWLGISIDGSDELRPLSQLGASPYALTIADHSVTASKMGTDYVSSISINGHKVSGVGANVNFVTGNGVDMSFDPVTNSILVQNNASGASSGKGAAIQGPDTTHLYEFGEEGKKTGILEMDNATSQYSVYIKTAATNANRNYLIPEVGTDAQFVMTAGNQTIGGVKTFSSAFNMSGNPIQNVATPSSTTDVSTKGYVDNAVNALTAALNQEISNRQAADASEATARANGDNVEAAARIAGDNSLSAALSAERANRTAADNTLTENINELAGSLQDEAAARAGAISAEASARQSAVTALQSALSSESAARVIADESLQNQIYNKADNTGLVHIDGAETINGQKTFAAQIVGNISGNAESVTNGVYLSGDQLIDGVKTFVNTIQGSISSIGGKSAAEVATSVDATVSATPNNINNSIVRRNGSGGFTIGMITGSIMGGTVSGSTLTATTASSGVTIGTGNSATSLTSSATGSAKTVTLPNYSGTVPVILKASSALDGATGTVDVTVNGAASGDYVMLTRKTFASGGGHNTGQLTAIASTNKVTVTSNDASDDSSFQVMVIKQ